MQMSDGHVVRTAERVILAYRVGDRRLTLIPQQLDPVEVGDVGMDEMGRIGGIGEDGVGQMVRWRGCLVKGRVVRADAGDAESVVSADGLQDTLSAPSTPECDEAKHLDTRYAVKRQKKKKRRGGS